MAKKYEHSWIAVDAVILTIDEVKLKVFLNKREKAPYKGLLELPGGLLLPGETAEQTLQRKLTESVHEENAYFRQFHTFTDPKRDPRERAISIGFMALVNNKKGTEWHPVDSLPKLAFDHNDIVKKAKQHLKENTSPSIVMRFMPEEFPLNALQEAYEIIEDKKYDNRNFRKKVIASEIVEETGRFEENVSHRPAKLFRFRRSSPAP